MSFRYISSLWLRLTRSSLSCSLLCWPTPRRNPSVRFAALCVTIVCDLNFVAGPYAQRVVDQVPKIGSTDGSFLESQFFYDMPTGTRVSSMNVTIDLKYGGKNENLRVWFFLRRYAPFDKERDLKHWTEKCQLSQAYPNNMNPYDCEMEEVIVNSGPQEAYVPA